MTIDIGYIVAVFVVILVSMTLHEAMHGFAAYWLGDTTAKEQGRLTLNPVAHIDPFLTLLLPMLLAVFGLPIFGAARPVPFNPTRVRYGDFGAALVGVAGPITNLLLAFFAFALYALSGAPGGVWGTVLGLGVTVNLGFFVFNMLPLPPLDGSRLLYAFAPDWARRGMEWLEQYGIFLVLAVVLLFGDAIGQFMGAAIGLFVDLFSQLFGV